ncbi:hypothetical protein IPJ70_03595 [Candidatus Campbellbacteria bacterium]|nr:MAG: hypothetical protein IPJ70_03595 [Candidatus Campbellbacteria bacterium]
MNWVTGSVLALVCWAAIYVFAAKAAHNGAEINLVLEVLGSLAVVAFMCRNISWGMIKANEVTLESCLYGLAGGVLYGLGLYFSLSVFTSTPERINESSVIAGMNPVLAVVLILIVQKLFPKFISEVGTLRPTQWAGVLFAALALVLITWDEGWTEGITTAVKKFF